jgi:hypothetical protein
MGKRIGSNNWRIMVGVAVATLGIFSSNIAYAADDIGGFLSEKLKKFTPPDIVVVTPAVDVPKECAAFAGEWGPVEFLYSRGNSAAKMVVESVAADCTIKVVQVWAARNSTGNDPGGGWARHNAKIVKGEFAMPGTGEVETQNE